MTRLGTVLSIGDPVMAELAAQALDFAWIDLEHGALSVRDAQVLALAVQGTGAQAYVRIPSHRAETLPAILDCGADGVVVPCVESAAEAREVVTRMTYPPAGARGFGPRRAGAFGRTTGYATSPAARPACVLQIESPAGVRAAEDIAAVRGVDALVLGCADLGMALGDAEGEMARAADAVAVAAERHGVRFGVAGSGPPERLAALAAGRAAEVVFSADVRLYAAGVDAQAEALRAALDGVRAPA